MHASPSRHRPDVDICDTAFEQNGCTIWWNARRCQSISTRGRPKERTCTNSLHGTYIVNYRTSLNRASLLADHPTTKPCFPFLEGPQQVLRPMSSGSLANRAAQSTVHRLRRLRDIEPRAKSARYNRLAMHSSNSTQSSNRQAVS